jgi:hypothetical protein
MEGAFAPLIFHRPGQLLMISFLWWNLCAGGMVAGVLDYGPLTYFFTDNWAFPYPRGVHIFSTTFFSKQFLITISLAFSGLYN